MFTNGGLPLNGRTRAVVTGIGIGVGFGLLHGFILFLIHPDQTIYFDFFIGLVVFMVAGVFVRVTLYSRQQIKEQLGIFSLAVEQSPSIVMITNLEGRITYVNPKFTDITGYTLDEARGQNPRFLKSGETPPEEYARLWQTITDGDTWRGEFHNVKKNGDQFWEIASISPIKNADGIVTHFLAAKQDITALKASQAAERSQRLRAEALSEAAAVLNSSLDLDTVLDRILQSIDPLITHTAATIMLVEDDMVRVVRVCPHLNAARKEKIVAARFPVAGLPDLRRMAATGAPLVIPDTHADHEWIITEEAGWIRSFAGAPIFREGRVLGFVNLFSDQPDFFTQSHADYLMAFANQAAVAICNAHLFAAERDNRALSEALSDTAATLNSTLNLDEVLDKILANVGRVVPHDAANIMLIEDGIARMVRCRGYQPRELAEAVMAVQMPVSDAPGISYMVGTRQPLIVPDVQQYPGWIEIEDTRWTRAYIGAPIRLYGAVIGILGLDSEQPGAFNLDHADRLLAFADQAATAIQNAQLFDAVRDQAVDLSDRIAARTRELDQQRAQLSTILDSLNEGVMYVEQGQIHYANQAFLNMLQITPDVLQERPDTLYRRFNVSGDEYEHMWSRIAAALARERNWRGQWRIRRTDGTEFDAEITFSPIKDGGDEITNNVIVVRDISQEQALQEQKNRFLAHAAHELRTPISNIKTRLYLLRKQPEKLDYHVDVIEHVADSMSGLAEDLLDVVRFERQTMHLQRRRLILQDVIHAAITLQLPEAERKNVWLVYELPGEPVCVCADWRRIHQVLTKLITNAIHHTPDDGHILVQLTTEDEHHAVIRVEDTGEGIEPRLLNQIFEPFFRANQADSEGLGLGLAIAHQIIHSHGGEIHVASDVNQGTVFSVRLALAGDEDCSS